MQEIVIQPSRKQIWLGFLAVSMVFILTLVLYSRLGEQAPPSWTLLLVLALYLWPAILLLTRRFTTLTLAAETLTFEAGLLTRTRRLLDVRKVQNVSVEQTLRQRMLNVGALIIETAGESSRLTMHNIDAPNRVAQQILDASRR